MLSLFRFVVIICLSLFGLSLKSDAQPNLELVITNSLAQEEVDTRLRTYGNDLMGDSIDPASGSLVFTQTDISLPGNSSLPVSLTRKTAGQLLQAETANFMGDWTLDIPNISMVMPKYEHDLGEVTSTHTTWPDRCTGGYPWAYVNDFFDHEITDGLDINIPGRGKEKIYTPLPNQPNIWGATTPVKATKGHLRVECQNAGGDQEYFWVTTPDGTLYKFDTLIYLDTEPLRTTISLNFAGIVQMIPKELDRVKAILYASQMIDKNGNEVNYDYNAQGQLTRIYSDDGDGVTTDERDITLSYTNDRVTSVTAIDAANTANNRIWSYSYTASGSLDRVTLPDGNYWDYDFADWRTRTLPGHCTRNDFTVSMKHPYGTIGIFTLSETRHGRTNTPFSPKQHPLEQHPPPIPDGCYEDYLHYVMPWYETLSVVEKTLTGPNLNSTWIYNYQEDDGSSQGYGNIPTPEGPADFKMTRVTDPEGNMIDYYHNRRWGPTNGQLAKIINRKPDGSAIKTMTNSYVISDAIFGNVVYSGAQFVDWAANVAASLMSDTVIEQDGDTYTTNQTYDYDPTSSAYSYGSPVTSSIHSNVSQTPRTFTTTYEHKKDVWVIGLPKTYSQNDQLIVSYDFDALGQLHKSYRYGQEVAEYNYNTDGTLTWVKDALGRKTEPNDWHRGKPQSVTKAAGASEAVTIGRTVDDNGWIMSQTDGRGYTTSYRRDSMGRVDRIFPHKDLGASPPALLSTTLIATYFGNDEIRQIINKGYERQFIYYDRLFRPIFERREGRVPGNSTAVPPPDKVTTTEYDALGRVVFKSYPYETANYEDGTAYTYDALGRILTETSTIDANVKTTYEYLPNNCTKVTDAEGNATTTCKDGYGGPGGGDVVSITQPEGIVTTLSYNGFGELEEVSQSGSTNPKKYFYNDERRLCRYRTPEAGDTLYKYDAAGQMTAYAKGIDDNSDSCADPSGPTLIELSYDDLGRLKTTEFADSGTPDIWRDYDANGNLTKVYRGQTEGGPCLTETLDANCWFYEYDPYNRLRAEELQIDDRSFEMKYYYNGFGFMTRKTLPTGQNVPIVNDVLGRTLAIGYGSGVHANTFSYHVNDQVKRFRYGNGHDYQTEQNALLQTSEIRIQKPAGAGTPNIWAVDMDYSYDYNGRLKTQDDALNPANDRAYTYDGAGRLESAVSPQWGTASYSYDPRGNLLSKSFTDWKGQGPRDVVNTYDPISNRVTNSADSANSPYSFGYDGRGNVTQTGGLAFSYDKADQPIVMSGTAPNTGTSVTGSYEYDGNLKRVKSVVNGITRYNVYDHQGRLTHVEEGDGNYVSETNYLIGAGMTLARIKDGVYSYMHPDHLGSPIAGTDEDGEIDFTEVYSPFGETLQNPAANDNQSGFTGHIKDADTGLNYMQARYYDPNVGRFLSIDPVTFMDTGDPRFFNRYAYTFNDPVNLTDPTGRNPLEGVYMYQDEANAYMASGMTRTQAANKIAKGRAIATAAVATAFVPGPEDLVIAGAAAKLGSNALRGKRVGDTINPNGSTKASDIINKSEEVGFTPSQTNNGPLKFKDENGVDRVTIKSGSDRAPDSSGPHVELKDSSGQRVSPSGENVTRKSPENHTPIIDDRNK